MKEFMLLIRNEGDQKTGLSPEQHQLFLKDCEIYIEKLVKKGALISAQPLIREGKMISGTPGAWKEGPYHEGSEIIVGYYHVLAEDIEAAIAIAKGNPEFAYSKLAKIEVRPVKMKEASTGFEYPKKHNR
ncbi:hypothetical protein CLV51_103498 [Chitinophaga niastensis]|uniref:YCII-related domain-containing protein n=1 Tax=Chitinophaga niastensis TaxID=536980 RepID=A0A2P8HJY0_CHINA|nr:YciI family protein [Chitinophaga niastensis]PSL46518.1 hypothetical protein CLV51_103498 [Chitinophaga niastensis]